jgi:hypothetical protein
MCPASELRNMAVVVALNGDYEGGDFCFPEQGRTIKLKKGQAIAFPPYWTHPHYTKDLEGGTVRYTVNCWTLFNHSGTYTPHRLPSKQHWLHR